MSRYYFREDDDERCYLKKDIIQDMKENGMELLKVFEAKIATGEDYAYCSKYQDAIEVRSGDCGKLCPDYQPRNGKNGRCRHSKNCYDPTDDFIILRVETK